MPLVPADYKTAIRPLFDRVIPCVVSIQALTPAKQVKHVIKGEALPPAEERRDATGVNKVETKLEPTGVGFIVHCSDNFTVVTVDQSFKFQGQQAIVKFWDETEATDTRLIRLKGPTNLIVANIAHGDWKAVRYDQIKEEGYSQIVLCIFSLMKRLLPCVSRIISPRCIAVLANGRKVPGSEQTFSFNLPMAGREHDKETKDHPAWFALLRDQVLGAPVFDTYGKLVGFVHQCGTSFDFKFGVRSEYLQDAMYKWLAGKQWKDVIKPRSHIWHPVDEELIDSSVGLRGGVGGLPHVPLDQEEDNFQFDSSVGLRGGVGGLPHVPLDQEEDNFQFDSLVASGDKEKEFEGDKGAVDKGSSDIADLRAKTFVADGVITKYFNHLSSKLNDNEVYLAGATVSSAYAQDASSINVELLRRSRLVLLPVNNNTNFDRVDMGTHWSLLLVDAISGPTPRFYHLDSLGGLNHSAAQRLATALGGVFPGAGDVVGVDTPKQKNGYDCAIYVMAFAKCVLRWWIRRAESTEHWKQMIQTDVTEENVRSLRLDFAAQLEQDEKNKSEFEDNFEFDLLFASGHNQISGGKEKEFQGDKVAVDKDSSDIAYLRIAKFVPASVITKYFNHLSSTKLNDDEVYLADAMVSSAYAHDASSINVELLRRSRLMFLPVNNNNFERADMGTHWSLFLVDAINGPPPQFYHMDSLGGLNRSAADRLATALAAVFPDAHSVVEVSTPQGNSYDCAIYVMALARSITTWWKSRTESKEDWKQTIWKDVNEESIRNLRFDFADRLEQDEKNKKVECNKEEKAKE